MKVVTKAYRVTAFTDLKVKLQYHYIPTNNAIKTCSIFLEKYASRDCFPTISKY